MFVLVFAFLNHVPKSDCKTLFVIRSIVSDICPQMDVSRHAHVMLMRNPFAQAVANLNKSPHFLTSKFIFVFSAGESASVRMNPSIFFMLGQSHVLLEHKLLCVGFLPSFGLLQKVNGISSTIYNISLIFDSKPTTFATGKVGGVHKLFFALPGNQLSNYGIVEITFFPS